MAFSPSPVGNLSGNQFGVRHDNLCVIKGLYHGGPQAELFDFAKFCAYPYGVANFDWTFEQQDYTSSKIAEDRLQSEPYTHTERSSKNSQIGHVEAERGEGKQHAHHNECIMQKSNY